MHDLTGLGGVQHCRYRAGTYIVSPLVQNRSLILDSWGIEDRHEELFVRVQAVAVWRRIALSSSDSLSIARCGSSCIFSGLWLQQRKAWGSVYPGIGMERFRLMVHIAQQAPQRWEGLIWLV